MKEKGMKEKGMTELREVSERVSQALKDAAGHDHDGAAFDRETAAHILRESMAMNGWKRTKVDAVLQRAGLIDPPLPEYPDGTIFTNKVTGHVFVQVPDEGDGKTWIGDDGQYYRATRTGIIEGRYAITMPDQQPVPRHEFEALRYRLLRLEKQVRDG